MDGRLMLRRKLGESVVIDGDIVVTVSDIRGGRVSLSLQAPPEVEIWRQELCDATGYPPEEVPHVPG